MKIIELILVFFLCAFSEGCTQSTFFEGELISKIKFEIKDSTKRAVYFSKSNPSQATEYFKQGSSFITYDKGDTYTYLYLQPENAVYQNRWSGDTLYKFDCNKQGRQILNYSIEKNAAVLLGISCNKLEVFFEGGSSTYFYNEQALKINPSWFIKLTYVNWDTISKILQSIPLKTVIERNDYRITSTVESFKEAKIDDTFFKISKTAIIVKDD